MCQENPSAAHILWASICAGSCAYPVNQNLRTVLVVARRKGACGIFRTDQTKAVALGAVLRGVVLQVQPEVVGEGVFVQLALFLVVEKSFSVPFQHGFRTISTVQNLLELALVFGRQGSALKSNAIGSRKPTMRMRSRCCGTKCAPSITRQWM